MFIYLFIYLFIASTRENEDTEKMSSLVLVVMTYYCFE